MLRPCETGKFPLRPYRFNGYNKTIMTERRALVDVALCEHFEPLKPVKPLTEK